jgi:hypothetical protein
MSMAPRLMVICLGGLAGAGALVCCDLDEGLDQVEAAPDGDARDADGEEAEATAIEGEPLPVH